MRDGQNVEAWFLYEDGPAVAEVFAWPPGIPADVAAATPEGVWKAA